MSRKSRPLVFGTEICLHVLPSSTDRRITPSDPEAQITYCSRSFLPASRTTLTPRRFASLPEDCTDHHGALSFKFMKSIAMRSNMADILPLADAEIAPAFYESTEMFSFLRLIHLALEMDYKLRQNELRKRLASCRLDGYLVSHLANIRYLCGFTGSAGLLLVEEAGSTFFTDVRYDRQGREEVQGARVIIARKGLMKALGERIGARRKKAKGWTIGVEAEPLTVAERKRLVDLLPSGVRL